MYIVTQFDNTRLTEGRTITGRRKFEINMSVRHQSGHTRSLISLRITLRGSKIVEFKERKRVTQDPRFPIANSEDSCQTEVMSKLI